MSKEKKPLFEEMTFTDKVQAQEFLKICEEKMQKNKKAMSIAAVATVCSILGYILGDYSIGAFILLIGMIMAIISYIMGGGIVIAISWAWKICKIGWYIVPYFPIDIVCGIAAFCLAVFGFFFIPVICVGLNGKQLKEDHRVVSQYLEQYRSANEQQD